MKNYKFYCYLTLFLCSSILFTSCSKDDDIDEPVEEFLSPIILDCDYFNENRVLKNDTLRPVDYVITCWTRLQGSLKIEPGVVIAFERNAGMLVDLDANLFNVSGTADEPIIFTGTSQQKGFWRGIFFTEAHNPNNKLEHAIIEYAGSEPLKPTSPIYEGSIAIRGVSGTTPQSLEMNDVTIRHGGSFGIDLSRIENNANVSVTNLTITENNGVAAKVTAEMAHIFDTTSKYTGNASDFINITSNYYEIEDQTVSWKQLDVPYLVDGRIHLKENGHLTIEAGTDILFKENAYIQVAPLNPPYNTSLKIEGTSSKPVLLSAYNGEYWGGIYYSFTPKDNKISHAVIENAKGDFEVGNIENKGAIYMHGSPKLSVDNTLMRNLPNCAFYGYTSNPFENLTVSNLVFENVGAEYCEE